MGRRFWIILGVILIIGLAVFIFLIWRPEIEKKKAIDEELATETTTQQQPFGRPQDNSQKKPKGVSGGVNLIIEESKGLEFKPFFEEGAEKIKETFLERFNALANFPISAPKSASDKKEQSAASAPEATSTEIILSLTGDEFHFLYPDDFIASLMEAQDLFIKEYDPNYEPLSKIETDSQVRFVEEKLVATLLLANMFTKEEAERAINTIRFTLPQLQLTELKTRKSFILNQSFMSFPLSPMPPLKGSFFAELVERIYSAFIPEAQAYACGYCYTLPECYQVGASGLTGSNTFKAFCYCTGCLKYLGCLSSCTGKPAIFDPTTFICGC